MVNDIEFVKGLLVDNFMALSCMSELGYVVERCEKIFSRASNSDAASLVVSSKEIDRCLKFVLIPNEDCLGVITVEIICPRHNQSFYLQHWIMKHRRAGLGSEFQLGQYSPDFEAALVGFFGFFKSLLDDPKLNKIIAGRRWENVEFNWGGMR